MAGVDPYAPCPCGSGQKFKWCCHKVEAFADKAQRLFEGGQGEAAIKVIDEGLRKEPGNPWLLTRKAIMQIRQDEPEPAKATLRLVLQKAPRHVGALVLLTRCVLETEGPVNGAGMFQQVLSTLDDAERPQLAPLAGVVAMMLVEARRIPAALKHLDLVARLGGDTDQSAASTARQVEASPAVSPWLKDRPGLARPPAQLEGDARGRFEQALDLADRGHWAPAAAAFDALSGDDPGGEADYNLGLCRLWLGDEEGAVAPLRRRSGRLGTTAEAVDLEALCQVLEPIHPDDRVEHVELTWPIRDREALLAVLRAQSDVFDEGTAPIDPDDPESPETDGFALLDKPRVDHHTGRGMAPDQIPRILGRVDVGREVAALETYDDGRIDTLGDRFTALAGTAIAPAHPRTKVLGEVSRSSLALIWEWLYPAGLETAEGDRLDREQRARMLRDVWPETSMPYLGFWTPLQAARNGDAEVPLRAALFQFEQGGDLERGGLDFAALRTRLNLPPEPAIEPESDALDRLPLARLASVPADRLDDDRLLILYRRARRGLMTVAMEAAAREIVARPALFENRPGDAVSVYADLATLTNARGEKDQARSWIARGRQADSPARRGPNAPLWDMIEIRLKARSEPPESWVPELAIILERYDGVPSANQILLRNLVEMGLIRMSPNPDNPEDILLDSRPMQALLNEYGPRVTTASGRLGVSATRPEVWTPGGAATGSGGALWTPGSGTGAPPAGDKPKLIIPGR